MKHDLFNLKLLMFFADLVRTRALLKTGEKYGLSAAGSSRALNRLREQFGDHLFESTNRGLTPTQFTLAIYPRILDSINSLSQLFEAESFDPSVCTRTFHLGARGYMTGKILRDIFPRLHAEAPLAHLEIHHRATEFADGIRDRFLDCAIVVERYCPEEFHYLPLHKMELCLIAGSQHPLFAAGFSEEVGPTDEEIGKWPIIHHRLGDNSLWNPEFHQNFSNYSKIPALCVDELSFVLPLLEQMDAVCLVPQEAADFAKERYQIRSMSLENSKLQTKTQNSLLIWHSRSQEDPALKWFRGLFKDWSIENSAKK